MAYFPRAVPVLDSLEAVRLYVEEELRRIALEFQETEIQYFRVLHVEPVKRADGMVVFADGTDWNPGDGAGVYERVAGAWVKLGNAVPDYVEGTFTPTIAFGGASVGVTYVQQAGIYTKVGRVVVFNLRVELSSKGSSVGDVSIGGLPFTVGANSGCSLWSDNVSVGSSVVLAGVAAAGTTRVDIWKNQSGNASIITDSDIANDTQFIIFGTYTV